MEDLIKKILASAERLVLPPGREAAQELPRFRAFLKEATHRIKLAHQNGAGGLEVCHARSALVDRVIRALWEAVLNTLSAQARKEFPPIAVVALGGYGRGELNPFSDIDLLFLHEGQVAGRAKPLPVLDKILNGVWLPLFDVGLKPGHAVRTIAECVTAANDKDDDRRIETRTSLIEARLIVGDEKLFAKFQKTVLAKCVAGYEDQYIAARLEDQATRRAKFGNSACMQEPNIKNGCGGLRDYQNLLWMAFFKYRTRSLTELEQHELVMPRERKQLEAAYDFLLRVRTQMHYHVEPAGGCVDEESAARGAHWAWATAIVRPASASRSSCATFILTRATFISSRARWSSGWRSSNNRRRASRCAGFCRAEKPPPPSRWTGSNSSRVKSTPRATVSSAISRAG